MRRSGITRKTGIKQGGTLKRGGFKPRKRKAPAKLEEVDGFLVSPRNAKAIKASRTSKPRKRLKQQSAKRTAENEVRREVLEELVRVRGDWCEAGRRLIGWLASHPDDRGGYEGCALTACDGHEKHLRSDGGSPTDPANILLVCRPCHDWTHAHPNAARSLGLLVSVSSEGTDEKGGNNGGTGNGDGGIVDDSPTDLRGLGDDGWPSSLVCVP